MKLKEVMTREVEVLRPDGTVEEAAQRMKALNVGLIPVCDGKSLVGMVTDRDITIRATAEGLDPKRTPVEQVMTRQLVFCYEDQDVQEAAQRMGEHQIRRLAILDRNKNLVGIVSLGDLAVKSDAPGATEEALEGISSPAERAA